MKILGISGSLRSYSINTALLEAAQIIAPDQIEVRLAHGMGELPHFNPDLVQHVPLWAGIGDSGVGDMAGEDDPPLGAGFGHTARYFVARGRGQQ